MRSRSSDDHGRSSMAAAAASSSGTVAASHLRCCRLIDVSRRHPATTRNEEGLVAPSEERRPAALVTGAGRRIGIATGITARLADDGWNLALSYWRPYETTSTAARATTRRSRSPTTSAGAGAAVVLLPGDLTDPAYPDRLVADAVGRARSAARPRPVARGVARFRDPRHHRRVVRPPHDRERPRELAADRRLHPPGRGRRGDRRADQRCHDVQPALRRLEGRPRPDRHRGGPRARPPGHPRQRRQPGTGRHGLDGRRPARGASQAPAHRAPRDARRTSRS